jgi:hypothetical protein
MDGAATTPSQSPPHKRAHSADTEIEGTSSAAKRRRRGSSSDDEVIVVEDDPDNLRAKQREEMIRRQREEASKPLSFKDMTCMICLDTFKDMTATHCG